LTTKVTLGLPRPVFSARLLLGRMRCLRSAVPKLRDLEIIG